MGGGKREAPRPKQKGVFKGETRRFPLEIAPAKPVITPPERRARSRRLSNPPSPPFLRAAQKNSRDAFASRLASTAQK